jgi:N,N-dimethylformamidase beta subunit-like, C-terminal
MAGVFLLAAMPGGGAIDAVAAGEPGGSTYAEPAVTASFAARSYAPGQTAQLTVRTSGAFRYQIFHAGAEARRARSDDLMAGVPVTASVRASGPGNVSVRVGNWPSGLYFARMQQGSLIGFAPFVVRPKVLGRDARVLVVLPTNTWQAYNFRDDNHDGIGDTWYASPAIHTVVLDRPFLHRGVPPHYRAYDAGFVHWLVHSGHRADVISDDDLERIGSAARLAKLYDLIVFSGHEEYVTPHVYDIVEGYRNLGGNLMFLSANNFFYRVTRTGNVLHGRTRWRDQGRPEEKLIGAQYVDWYDWDGQAHPNRPYTVVGAKRAKWLFGPAGLRNGDTFGNFGIEIDARGADSPPGTEVLAKIPDEFGPGKSAEMTYYQTARGAKVFDAGVINFGGSALQPPVSRLLDALWARLSRP